MCHQIHHAVVRKKKQKSIHNNPVLEQNPCGQFNAYLWYLNLKFLQIRVNLEKP